MSALPHAGDAERGPDDAPRTGRAAPLPVRLPSALGLPDIFSIGIGPSSSHTVGPMRAAADFARRATARGRVTAVACALYGSLALTGRGHATDRAVRLGLMGETPETVDPDAVDGLLATARRDGRLWLDGRDAVPYAEDALPVFHPRQFHPTHANALTLTACYAGDESWSATYFSVGGGAIEREGAVAAVRNSVTPRPYESARAMLAVAAQAGLSLAELFLTNEDARRDRAESEAFLDRVRAAMLDCIERGTRAQGILPGGLKVRRRARDLAARLAGRARTGPEPSFVEWISLYALAVNEENAAGGRVVTAPTNGAAGIIPAVLRYYEDYVPGATRAGSRTLLATAAAICGLYKTRASISAAEMGCQGEVGVACSMAAAGLTAAMGGTNAQVENAAEIGMEHNLGLTCDPIGGLVQIPCIERNSMGAIKAINAALLALNGDGAHHVPLDAVIETMRQTGRDMRRRYKETSLGGLAVNVVEC